MPWSQTSPMNQRTKFIADYLRDELRHHRAVRALRMARKTGYKLHRSLSCATAAGARRAIARSRSTRPTRTEPEIVAALLELSVSDIRRWGAKKLLAIVSRRHRDGPCPDDQRHRDILQSARHG